MVNNKFITEIIQFIETHLNENLDVEDLSKAIYRSRMQLHRDFYSAVGHTVKSYIAKRRLSVALAHIKASEFPLADIAYLTGYSSQQALCRAVKHEIGMTPLEYRHSNAYFEFPPYNGIPLYSVTVSEEKIPETLRLQFYHQSLRGLEDRAVDRLFRAIPGFKGRIFGKNGNQRGNRFCYELLITDAKGNIAQLKKAGFEVAQYQPSAKRLYATVTVLNVEEKIGQAWDYLYKTWLGSSMFKYTDTSYFEEYIQSNPNMGYRHTKLRLYLPIQKRGENMQIYLIDNPNLHFLVSRAQGYYAERDASRRVIEYISAHHPYSMKISREFFIQKSNGYTCTCGVRIGSPVDVDRIHDTDICGYSTEGLQYLVLESSVMGDYDRMAELLMCFADNNHFDVDAYDLFAVYDAKRSYDNPKIRMYCGVKVLQNGNTSARNMGIISVP